MKQDRTLWAAKHALHDVFFTSEMKDSDKTEVLKYIKEAKSFEELLTVFEDTRTFNEKRNDYFDVINEGIDVSFYNVNDFESRRNNLLMEKEDEGPLTPEGQKKKRWRDWAKIGAGVGTGLYLGRQIPGKSGGGLYWLYNKSLLGYPFRAVARGVNVLYQGAKGVVSVVDALANPNLWKATGQALIGFGGITLLAAAAYQVYDRYFSLAAKNCIGRSGVDRSICIIQYKIIAAEKALAKLKEALPSCKTARNPRKCEFKIHKQIYFWTHRLDVYKRKLAKYQWRKSRQPQSQPGPNQPQQPQPTPFSMKRKK